GVISDGTAPNVSPETDLVVSISWGDGQTSTGRVVANGQGTFDVLGSHSYLNPSPAGGYTVVGTGRDTRSGPKISFTTHAVVQDAAAVLPTFLQQELDSVPDVFDAALANVNVPFVGDALSRGLGDVVSTFEPGLVAAAQAGLPAQTGGQFNLDQVRNAIFQN